ncbi:response regulator [Natronomonas sp.]|uniref:response regulator n=1 Tax=Natronomonas sp. TaxID=2184060 RepID=UPI00398933DB
MAREDEANSLVDIPGIAGIPSTEPSDLGDISILFVDDERQLLSILSSKLKEEIDSLEVVTASHGTEGLELLEKMDIDCIVSDYKMPGMDGLELLKECRERDPDIPFILFTSKGSEAVATEAINANVTDYLQKNFGEEQYALLANRIENAVSQYRAKQLAQDTYEHIRRIHDRISDAYLGLDSDWRITYLDEEAAGLFNNTRTELIGETFWEALPQAVGSPFEAQFKRALETQEQVDFETHYEPFNTWFEVRAFPSEAGLSVYFRDITGLKYRDEEIERQRERLTTASDGVAELRQAVETLEARASRATDACACEDDSLDAVTETTAELAELVDGLESALEE